MFFAIFRFFGLVWRYRRLVALLLTVIAGIMERHRSKLPRRMQNVDLGVIPGVRSPRQNGDSVDRPAR